MLSASYLSLSISPPPPHSCFHLGSTAIPETLDLDGDCNTIVREGAEILDESKVIEKCQIQWVDH